MAYTIRLARTTDLPYLPDIEQAAAALFVPYGLAALFSTRLTPWEALAAGQACGTLWVAVEPHDRPVGFALAGEVGANAHLDELDVHPEHGRQGLGRRLVKTVCAWARQGGYPAVTLTTLDYVPWNAPFYARLGFKILDEHELSPELRALLQAEVEAGLPGEGRVAMQLDLETHSGYHGSVMRRK
ncbi:MAG: GNAT family N-acetyltransferase [Anaerolineales bacterium]|jgi:GNAT superfamily N-acetyltransferase